MITELLCISLLVGSMGLLIDLSNKSSINSKRELNQFKIATQKKLKFFNNEKGQVSLVGITTLLFLSLLFYFFLQKMQIEKNEIKYRSNTYQCFFEYTKNLESFVNNISKTNQAIMALNLLKYSGTIPVETEMALKGLKIIQNSKYSLLVNSIMKNQTCNTLNKVALIKQLPYKREALDFERNLLGITIVKDTKWNLKFIGPITKIRKKNLFYIDTEFSLANAITSTIKMYAIEKELLNLSSHLSSP